MSKLFEPRCRHRHTRAEHPQCFTKLLKADGNLPKILILDIETAPMEVMVWGLRDNNYISPDNVLKDYFILSWSAKWLFGRDTMSAAVNSLQALARDDKKIMEPLWSLLDKADIIVAHNGKRFDLKKINSRFIINGFVPPAPYDVIDTLTVCRSIFGFSSNALNYLNKILGLDIKIDTGGYGLWRKCVDGDEDALHDMETYNRNDVVILEELYLTLRPWIKSHPNVGLYMDLDKPVCRNCGSPNLQYDGTTKTPTGMYELYRCQCGAIGRMRKNRLTKEHRNNLLV